MDTLQDEEKRVLEHFWNSDQRVKRSKLPLSVIAFLDDESLKKPHTPSQAPPVLVILERLRTRKYVRQSSGGFSQFEYELDVEGNTYLERAHPSLLVLWDNVVARIPRILIVVVTLIGLVSSVLGIMQYLGK